MMYKSKKNQNTKPIFEYLKEQQKLQKPMQKADKAKKKRSIHPSRQIRTKFYLHQHSYRRFKQNQDELRMPNKTTVTKISSNNKMYKLPTETLQNHNQDLQFMTLFPGINLDQIKNNANTQLTKSSYQQIDLQNKRPKEFVRRFDV
ncbi:Hypothetical_protein [Hexamita inflata]|uniref:Hypothetical_protein n=1 Tax=Hexamita inflata TaxID=28002 RepID=A0AA86P269_9EUKA|nr:Hypothetical protein HINF_LOCUS16871 [Hexamita inflata]